MSMDTNADRLARIEEGVKTLHSKVDESRIEQSRIVDTQTRHAIEIAIIKSRSAAWKVLLAVLGPLVALAAFVLVLLNQLYGTN